jgi:hypothetical protein
MFGCVSRGIGCQFALREFKHGVSFILEAAKVLDLPKDPNSVVHDNDLRERRVLLDPHPQLCAAGMVDGIVHHFANAVLP